MLLPVGTLPGNYWSHGLLSNPSLMGWDDLTIKELFTVIQNKCQLISPGWCHGSCIFYKEITYHLLTYLLLTVINHE